MPMTRQDDQAWRLRQGGRWGATWEEGLSNYLGLKFLWHFMFRNDDAAFSGYSSTLLNLLLQVGKKATALSGGWKFWGYHCQDSPLTLSLLGYLKTRIHWGGQFDPPSPFKSHIWCPNMTNGTTLESSCTLLLESAKKFANLQKLNFFLQNPVV